MNSDNEHLDKISGFKVPDDYFKNLEDQILRSIHLNEKLDSSGFKVPESYFDTIENRVMSQLGVPSKTKVINLWNWKTVASISAVAASVILMLNMFINNTNKSAFRKLDTNAMASYITEEDYSSYELASILDYENLSAESFVNNDIPKDNLEDYLLDQSDLENLILD